MHCAFCEDENINQRVVLENDLARAFLGLQPIVPGHTLIIPKRCVRKFENLSTEERNAIFDLMNKTKNALEKTFDCEGFNHAWNENLIAGQTIPHFHLHVVPRKKGDEGINEYEPRKYLYRTGERTESSLEQIAEIARKVCRNVQR